MSAATICAIDFHLPKNVLSNAELAAEFPSWGAEKIAQKTGIVERHIAADGECSSDLAEIAARKLLSRVQMDPKDVDFLIFCTQTPDFGLPTSACLLQNRLGLPTTAGALDYNLGCSGYVYGLALAKGLIESGQSKRLLLLNGETYSKLLCPTDKTVRTIFGDAGSATLIICDESRPQGSCIGPTSFGTDGEGGRNLVSWRGGWRGKMAEAKGRDMLWMNGPEIFNFTLDVVPEVIRRTLGQAALKMEDIDLFVFHQANKYMLEHLRQKLQIPSEKFLIALERFGNTVSCTIPIALRQAQVDGRLQVDQKLLLVGFGVGYSWGAVIVKWRGQQEVQTLAQ